MKIAITGAQSTGKSTLLDALKQQPVLSEFVFIDELTRKIKNKGVVINEDGDDLTQLLTLNTHLSNIINTNFISDRCILDAFVYTKWLYNKGKISDWVNDYSTELLAKLIDRYDYIFYLTPDFDLQPDGVRSSSDEFRKEIAYLFEYYIERFNLDVYHLQGTTEQRVNKFLHYIK